MGAPFDTKGPHFATLPTNTNCQTEALHTSFTRVKSGAPPFWGSFFTMTYKVFILIYRKVTEPACKVQIIHLLSSRWS